jgi:hypothetical protein
MKKLVKVVKAVKRNQASDSERTKVPVVRNRWSKVIRSWVVELRQKEQELLPAFESLFKKEVRKKEPQAETCLPETVGVKAVD